MSAVAWGAPPGSSGTRLSRPLVIGGFAGGLAGVVAVGAVVLAASAPSRTKLACTPGRICTPPPIPSPELTTQLVWRSALGVRVEYDRRWSVVQRSAQALKLKDPNVLLWIETVPSAKVSLTSLYRHRVTALRHDLPDLEEDTKPEHRLVGAEIGYVNGIGGVFAGTRFRSPRNRVSALVLAAQRSDVTVVASVATGHVDWIGSRTAQASAASLFLPADLALNSVRWPPG